MPRKERIKTTTKKCLVPFLVPHSLPLRRYVHAHWKGFVIGELPLHFLFIESLSHHRSGGLWVKVSEFDWSVSWWYFKAVPQRPGMGFLPCSCGTIKYSTHTHTENLWYLLLTSALSSLSLRWRKCHAYLPWDRSLTLTDDASCVCVCLCICTRETFKEGERGRPTGWSTTSIWLQRIWTFSTFKHRLTNEGHASCISLYLCPLNVIKWSGVSWLLMLIHLCRTTWIQNIYRGGRSGQVRIIEVQVCLRLSERSRSVSIQCVFGNNVTC